MHYHPELNDHGLAHDPFKALVAPRPIGWISTLSGDGRGNLAPYSFFNAISTKPHMVMVSSEGLKDTIRNIAETGEFVCSLATFDLRAEMNASSAPLPHGESEFAATGLVGAPSLKVRPPRVAASPIALECVAVEVRALTDRHGRPLDRHIAIGEVVAVHIDDRLIVDGRVDITRARPIARLGYKDYAVIDAVFELTRPPGG
jgi:flavin reductase (DIM6/NTAB) family NADH-FMN oxidoreductase RutF